MGGDTEHKSVTDLPQLHNLSMATDDQHTKVQQQNTITFAVIHPFYSDIPLV